MDLLTRLLCFKLHEINEAELRWGLYCAHSKFDPVLYGDVYIKYAILNWNKMYITYSALAVAWFVFLVSFFHVLERKLVSRWIWGFFCVALPSRCFPCMVAKLIKNKFTFYLDYMHYSKYLENLLQTPSSLQYFTDWYRGLNALFRTLH